MRDEKRLATRSISICTLHLADPNRTKLTPSQRGLLTQVGLPVLTNSSISRTKGKENKNNLRLNTSRTVWLIAGSLRTWEREPEDRARKREEEDKAGGGEEIHYSLGGEGVLYVCMGDEKRVR